jgi:hypothetical protein
MKKILLVAVIVLAIILFFVKDVGVYLGLSIVMALATWLVGRVWGYTTKNAITKILALAVILPMAYFALIGMIGMQANPSIANEISAKTIERITSFFTDEIVYVLLADVAGIIAGLVISIFK